ncbi:MAG: hypothetical protein ACJ0GU_00200 [Gammaproteobacteria bacterium]|tara:strand:+ start:1150 stop:1368 length:219 start_codon:yes stop_codon:yes gene_type:complete
MTISTLLLLVLGMSSFLLFIYLLRFKASKKQTERDNRLKWSSYFSYGDNSEEKNSLDKEVQPSTKEDAEFKE